MTGQVAQQEGDDDLAKQFIGSDAQEVANLGLKVGEMVNINTVWTTNQYGRTEINVIGVWRDQPQQQGAPQQQGNAPW